MKASVTDGPARSAIAAAVRDEQAGADDGADAERDERTGPRVRLSVPSPVAAPSAISWSIGFVRVSGHPVDPPWKG